MEELKLGNRVLFPGKIGQQDLPSIYNGADLFILPSLYEGFGLVLLEAMAAGTLVTASNISSIPEVTGDAALLFDPHDVTAIQDAITRILTDTSLHEELRCKGIDRARLFSWDKTVRMTLDVYREEGGS